MPNREHDDSYYDRARVRTDRSYPATSERTPRRSLGYNQAEFDRDQASYAPEWRSYAQDWRDRPQPLPAQEHSLRNWPRAEGYAQQRTDSGHRHESVFGEQESLREEWDRGLRRNRTSLHTDPRQRVQFAPQHDEESLGQQIRHASHAMVNRVKRVFRGPKGYKRSDDRIREDVNERLTHQDQIDPSEIEVRVESGEVTLVGTVHSRWDKFAAEEIAADVSGVEEVHNQLRVQRADPMHTGASRSVDSLTEPESLLRNFNIRA